MSFADDWIRRTRREVNTITEAIFIQVCTRIVVQTPVGDISTWENKPKDGYRPGTLANSWFAGIGDPPGGLVSREHNVNAQASLADIQATAESFSGRVAYLVNPTPYANRAEYLGWPVKGAAPYRMVGLTVNEFRQIVDIAVNQRRGR